MGQIFFQNTRKRQIIYSVFLRMLLLRRPYIFFVLFLICWVPGLFFFVIDLFEVSIPLALESKLIGISYAVIVPQSILAILYWISLFMQRKQRHVANYRLNIASVLVTALLFFYTIDLTLFTLWAVLT